MPRPLKYATEEERIEAKRKARREYMQRKRAMEAKPQRKPGRPRKYFTPEEKHEAQLKQQRERRLKKKMLALSADKSVSNESEEHSQ